MGELPLYVHKHKAICPEGKRHGEVIGQKFALSFVVAGLVFHTSFLFGDDDCVDEKIEQIRSQIGDTKIEVIK